MKDVNPLCSGRKNLRSQPILGLGPSQGVEGLCPYAQGREEGSLTMGQAMSHCPCSSPARWSHPPSLSEVIGVGCWCLLVKATASDPHAFLLLGLAHLGAACEHAQMLFLLIRKCGERWRWGPSACSFCPREGCWALYRAGRKGAGGPAFSRGLEPACGAVTVRRYPGGAGPSLGLDPASHPLLTHSALLRATQVYPALAALDVGGCVPSVACPWGL